MNDNTDASANDQVGNAQDSGGQSPEMDAPPVVNEGVASLPQTGVSAAQGEEREERPVRVLTDGAEKDREAFHAEYGDGNCACHISPPCSSCTHPGNPLNQEGDEFWRELPICEKSQVEEIEREAQGIPLPEMEEALRQNGWQRFHGLQGSYWESRHGERFLYAADAYVTMKQAEILAANIPSSMRKELSYPGDEQRTKLETERVRVRLNLRPSFTEREIKEMLDIAGNDLISVRNLIGKKPMVHPEGCTCPRYWNVSKQGHLGTCPLVAGKVDFDVQEDDQKRAQLESAGFWCRDGYWERKGDDYRYTFFGAWTVFMQEALENGSKLQAARKALEAITCTCGPDRHVERNGHNPDCPLSDRSLTDTKKYGGPDLSQFTCICGKPVTKLGDETHALYCPIRTKIPDGNEGSPVPGPITIQLRDEGDGVRVDIWFPDSMSQRHREAAAFAIHREVFGAKMASDDCGLVLNQTVEHIPEAGESNYHRELGIAMSKDGPRYLLWKFFADEHDLSLLESELNEILHEVEKYHLRRMGFEKDAVLPGDIHHNPDARVWATYFHNTLLRMAKDEWRKHRKPDELYQSSVDDYAGQLALDTDWMHGWFSNAMMAMHDSLASKGRLKETIDPDAWVRGIPTELHTKIGEAMGAASLCWQPRPGDQVFDSEKCEKHVNELCAWVAKFLKAEQVKGYIAGIKDYEDKNREKQRSTLEDVKNLNEQLHQAKERVFILAAACITFGVILLGAILTIAALAFQK